LTIAIES